jgi:hypothetical protein
VPELPGDIKFADQANVVAMLRSERGCLRPGGRFALADNPLDHHLAGFIDGPQRSSLLGIQQVIMLGELAVNRVLDRLVPE